MATKTFMQAYQQQFITRNWGTIRQVQKPVISAVSGFALGSSRVPAGRSGCHHLRGQRPQRGKGQGLHQPRL